jgi:RNA polymerase sigma-70 factor, ECF subfamily
LKPKITYTNDELVSEIRNKNQKAFAYLYDNYSKALFGVIDSIVNNTEVSEDVLQNAFIKIWNNFDSYDATKGRLYTWLLNVCRNLAIDCKRSKHEQIKSKIQEPTENVYHHSKLYVEDKAHETIGIKEMVHELKDEHQELIELAYYQGYTQQEISEKLNLPLGTVKTKIRQAILILRELTKDNLNMPSAS